MPKYAIDIDEPSRCDECPLFNDGRDDYGIRCTLNPNGEVKSAKVKFLHDNGVYSFDYTDLPYGKIGEYLEIKPWWYLRPDWCPLVELGDAVATLPVDRNNNPIHIGDALKLEHNGKTVHVRVMELYDNGWAIFPEESGGGWLMPESKSNVVVVDGRPYRYPSDFGSGAYADMSGNTLPKDCNGNAIRSSSVGRVKDSGEEVEFNVYSIAEGFWMLISADEEDVHGV